MSPSFSYLVFYTVTFFINVMQITLRHYGTSDKQAIQFLRETLVIGIGCATLFWILQSREIRNFFA